MNTQDTELAVRCVEEGPEADVFLAPLSRARPATRLAVTPLELLPQGGPRSIVRRRRFWHIVSFIFAFIVALYLLGAFRRPRKSSYGLPKVYKYGPSQCLDRVNWTRTTGSVGPSGDFEATYHARTTFTVPITAGELSFVSEGALQHGNFEIVQDLDRGSDDAVVDVRVSYHHPEGLDDAAVCRLHPNEGTWGLGIFTPHSNTPHLELNLHFHITLRLPTADPHAPLSLKGLFTDMPYFAHRVPELAESVSFDYVKLRGGISPIQADSLSGHRLSLHTENGVISGTYRASDVLDVQTSNAPISVYATVVSRGGHPSSLILKSTNGRIDGDITLHSNASDGTGGTFHVFAHSSNAPLVLAVVDAPVDSALDLTARTSNAPARVKVHKTFEGTLDVSSSTFFRPEVTWARVEDPAGRGRTRHVFVDKIRGSRVRGDVFWAHADGSGSGGAQGGGGDGPKGRVVLETSNAMLRLTL